MLPPLPSSQLVEAVEDEVASLSQAIPACALPGARSSPGCQTRDRKCLAGVDWPPDPGLG